RRHGNDRNSVNARRRAVTCLRTELSHSVCNESSAQGKDADCRSGLRVQKVEQVSYPKAFAFEIGRVGRSCFQKERRVKVADRMERAGRATLEDRVVLITGASADYIGRMGG